MQNINQKGFTELSRSGKYTCPHECSTGIVLSSENIIFLDKALFTSEIKKSI